MRILMSIFFALLICGGAEARTQVIESNKVILAQQESFAHHGDEFVRVRWARLPNPPEGGQLWSIRAIVHKRTATGEWPNVQTLWTETYPYDISGIGVAMDAHTITVAMPNGIRIFERGRFRWQEAPVEMPVRPTGWGLDLSGNDILTQEDSVYGTPLLISRGADGVWRRSAEFPTPAGWYPSWSDLDGDRLVLGLFRGQTEPSSAVEIFERSAGVWNRVAHFEGHEGSGIEGSFGPQAAIKGSLALVSGFDSGVHVFRRDNAGHWSETGHWQNPGSGRYDGAGYVQITEDYVLRSGVIRRLDASGLYLYRRLPDGGFQLLANFIGAPDDPIEYGTLSTVGNRILAATYSGALIEFELPPDYSLPPLRQFDAEDADISGWAVLPGSDFYQADIGITSVFRQASTASDTGAIHDVVMDNQSIAADVRVNEFSGGAWAGIVTRYTDELRNYSVRLDGSGKLALVRTQAGEVTELRAANVAVTVGETFHLRLESIGGHHVVYVDGQPVISVHDLALSNGRTGIRMHRAAVDYDNIVISPGPTTEMLYSDIRTSGGDWADEFWFSSNDRDFLQRDAAAPEALRLTGHASQDHAVQAVVTVSQFTEAASSAGLIARYVDASNYWFVTINGQNQLSLKRKRGGVVTNVSTIPLTVRAGRPVVLKLEMVGTKVRVFVNGMLRVERANVGTASGKVGLLTQRAAVRIDAYTADEL